jgi:phage repressor protein C with HTH and peptisase S24 domain
MLSKYCLALIATDKNGMLQPKQLLLQFEITNSNTENIGSSTQSLAKWLITADANNVTDNQELKHRT